ncbi:hypothetical protein NX059_000720 [Plenodomus lindquistii]|nr:hypothetical protein NX059_000720 [Plenodomus lindquistii]
MLQSPQLLVGFAMPTPTLLIPIFRPPVMDIVINAQYRIRSREQKIFYVVSVDIFDSVICFAVFERRRQSLLEHGKRSRLFSIVLYTPFYSSPLCLGSRHWRLVTRN